MAEDGEEAVTEADSEVPRGADSQEQIQTPPSTAVRKDIGQEIASRMMHGGSTGEGRISIFDHTA